MVVVHEDVCICVYIYEYIHTSKYYDIEYM